MEGDVIMLMIKSCWELYFDEQYARRAVDSRSECRGTAEMGLPSRQVIGQGRRWDFRGVIDPLLSWRESIGRKRDRGGKYRGTLQVPRQDRRAETKELHKIDVDGLLIKIVESEGLRVDAGMLDQGTK
ncbi:hypothetical protein B296_00032528 [Ensete ventricosum]|uniref:Uncharacterized protein n=1 Tax=Ensete ventricosum TaxID=4639 RepID=A0A426YBR7_ENSVE|nr:hypothetical protein B296_00032528 [Ensete ventricosum]